MFRIFISVVLFLLPCNLFYISNYSLVERSGELLAYQTTLSGAYPRGIKIFIFDKKKMSYGVSLERPKNKDFVLNSNFFTDNAPIGLVLDAGRILNPKVRGGGFFYVKNNIPYIGQRVPKKTESASQTFLVGIKDGRKNVKILSPETAKEKTYRSLLGEDGDGNFILIVTGDHFCRASIEEMLDIGLDFGIETGVLFDGGPSVDYKLGLSKTSYSFKANVLFNGLRLAEDPMVYIHGSLK